MLQWEPGMPIAIVEAKDNTHSVSHGMQQALSYEYSKFLRIQLQW